MFGNTFGGGNNAFGASTSFGAGGAAASPFGGGNNTFGQQNNNPTANPFGANNIGFGQQSNNANANPFGGGSNAFGQQNNNATANPFGGGNNMFGQPNNNATANPFGGGNNNTAFGSPTPAFGGAPMTNNAFGSPTANNNNNIFGGGVAGGVAGGAFGSQLGGGGGTRNVQYTPYRVPQQGGMKEAGWTYTSISYMHQFKNMSHEELRIQDLMGGAGGGGGNTQLALSNTFGSGAANNNIGGFGSPAANNPFGGPAAANNPFGGGANNIGFGQQSNNANANPFGGGSNAFGQQNNNATANPFGGGNNMFGQPNNNATANPFGGGNNNTAFGSPTPAFGGAPMTNNAFGSPTATNNNMFGSTTNNSIGGLGGGTSSFNFGGGNGTTNGASNMFSSGGGGGGGGGANGAFSFGGGGTSTGGGGTSSGMFSGGATGGGASSFNFGGGTGTTNGASNMFSSGGGGGGGANGAFSFGGGGTTTGGGAFNFGGANGNMFGGTGSSNFGTSAPNLANNTQGNTRASRSGEDELLIRSILTTTSSAQDTMHLNDVDKTLKFAVQKHKDFSQKHAEALIEQAHGDQGHINQDVVNSTAQKFTQIAAVAGRQRSTNRIKPRGLNYSRKLTEPPPTAPPYSVSPTPRSGIRSEMTTSESVLGNMKLQENKGHEVEEEDWRNDPNDPVNTPIGGHSSRRRGHIRGHNDDDENYDTPSRRNIIRDNDDDDLRVKSSDYPRLPKCYDGNSPIEIFLNNQPITHKKFQSLKDYSSLKNFGLRDPYVGRIDWLDEVSLIASKDSTGNGGRVNYLDVSKIISFILDDEGDAEITVYDDYVPKEGTDLNKRCLITLYLPAAETPSQEYMENIHNDISNKKQPASLFSYYFYNSLSPEEEKKMGKEYEGKIKSGRGEKQLRRRVRNTKSEPYDELAIAYQYFVEDN
jgi:hypothetical protein